LKGDYQIIDAVRFAMLTRQQADLELAGDEPVSLSPLVKEPMFP